MKIAIVSTFAALLGASIVLPVSGKAVNCLAQQLPSPNKRKVAFALVTPPEDHFVPKVHSIQALSQLRGGGIVPFTPEQLARFYSVLYLFHSTVMQGNPNMMAQFYGATEQVKGSIEDLWYSSAANSQFGLGILLYLVAAKRSQMSFSKAVGWSFLPYLADAIPILSYSTRDSSINVNFLTLWSLLIGGSSIASLDSGLSSASQSLIKLTSYVAFGIGLVGSVMPASVCEKLVGPNIDGRAQTIALFMGREIILAMHGGYAAAILNGVEPLKALGILTALFVVIATYVGHIGDGRKAMKVTNITAWNGWILSSALVALGTLL